MLALAITTRARPAEAGLGVRPPPPPNLDRPLTSCPVASPGPYQVTGSLYPLSDSSLSSRLQPGLLAPALSFLTRCLASTCMCMYVCVHMCTLCTHAHTHKPGHVVCMADGPGFKKQRAFLKPPGQ